MKTALEMARLTDTNTAATAYEARVEGVTYRWSNFACRWIPVG